MSPEKEGLSGSDLPDVSSATLINLLSLYASTALLLLLVVGVVVAVVVVVGRWRAGCAHPTCCPLCLARCQAMALGRGNQRAQVQPPGGVGGRNGGGHMGPGGSCIATVVT